MLINLILVVNSLQATNYYSDPINGSSTNDGSYENPWGSLKEVLSSRFAFQPGDTIFARSGDHGKVYLSRKDNTGYVTVAAEPGHTPVLVKLGITSSEFWAFSGLTISPEPSGVLSTDRLVYMDGASSDIKFENCTLYSVSSIEGYTRADWTNNMAEFAFLMLGPNVTLRNNTITNINFGIEIRGRYSVVEYNTIENIMGDGIRGLASFCSYEYNVVKNFYNIDDNANHDDGFQSYSNYEDPVSDVILRGNKFISFTKTGDPETGQMQGIAMFDGFFENWTIENNLVVTDHWHGISLYGVNNSKIINNTSVKNPIDFWGLTPWITVKPHKDARPSNNNVIRNNLATDIIDDGVGTIVENNLVIGTGDYSLYFEDANNFNFDLTTTSAAIDAGISTDAPTIDINKNPRPLGANWDVGCYEKDGISDTTPPSVPKGLSAGQTGARNAKISWDASTDNNGIREYNIYIDGVKEFSTATTSVIIPELSPATTYSIEVSAVDLSGNESSMSGSVNVVTEQDYSVIISASAYQDPNIPQNVIDGDMATRWSSEGEQWIMFELTSSVIVKSVDIAYLLGDERLSYFDIELSVDGNNWTQVYSGETTGNTEFPVNYEFADQNAKFVKLNGHGNSSSAWNSITELEIHMGEAVVDTEAPSVPVNLTSSNVTANSVDLSWDESTDNMAVTGYNVYIDGSNPVNVSTNSATITGLSALTSYSFTISALDGAGNESAQSAELMVTTSDVACDIVATASGSNNGTAPEYTLDGDFNTIWGTRTIGEWLNYELCSVSTISSIDIAFNNGTAKVYYFDIEVSNDGVNYTQVYSGQSSGTTVSLENFDFADVSTTNVRIVANGNSGRPSGNFDITEVQINISGLAKKSSALSVDNNSLDKSVLYPNPLSVGKQFFINTTGFSENTVMTVYDLTGKLITTEFVGKTNEYKSNVSLSKGVYIILLTDGVFSKTQKLIVSF